MRKVQKSHSQGKQIEYNKNKWSKKKGQNILIVTGPTEESKPALLWEFEETPDVKVIHTDIWIDDMVGKEINTPKEIITDEVFKTLKAFLEVAREDHKQLYLLEGFLIYFLSKEQLRELDIYNFPIVITDASMNSIILRTMELRESQGRTTDFSEMMRKNFIQRYILLAKFVDEIEQNQK